MGYVLLSCVCVCVCDIFYRYHFVSSLIQNSQNALCAYTDTGIYLEMYTNAELTS